MNGSFLYSFWFKRFSRFDWGRFVFLIIVFSLFTSGCAETGLSKLSKIITFPSTDSEDVQEEETPKPIPTVKTEKQAPVPKDTSKGWHTNIIATYFDIEAYPKPQTAWNDMDALDENPYYLALPFNNRVPGFGGYGQCKNRWIEIICTATGKRAFGQWEDVGPWFINDVEYVFDETGSVRPFAEIHKGETWNIYRQRSGKGARKPRTVLNGAGIDLSPKLASYLGIKGKSRVKWRFVDSDAVVSGPWTEKISTSPAHYRQRFYMLSGERFEPWELTTTLYHE